ncbi:hypothetical protein AJ80_08928 [Polytolypa hystricis UAMH7299]|uniref:Ketoreductase domain-containing protein n=1 Tax=Polytolypa hystricis (strain UAMH7299) TaxID=1447883 RepID=A0A2B7WRM4_POLH7|nr:hypothetical protein AJ80_08928 [Polytolypa hystricis UAMH7299]
MSSTSTIVLITGANSGVGYSTCRFLATVSSQYHIVMTGRNLDNVTKALSDIQAAGDIKSSLSALQLDVTDEQSIDVAAKEVEKQFGRLDVLINNAGVMSQAPTLKQQLRDTFETNCTGPALVTAAFESLLLKSKTAYLLHISSALGSLNIASTPGSQWYSPDGTVYRASKAALSAIAIQDHKRLSKHGVKVFTVCPGLVRSNLRGKTEEAISVGGAAGDPMDSARLLWVIIQGKRDSDVGKFVYADGVWPW